MNVRRLSSVGQADMRNIAAACGAAASGGAAPEAILFGAQNQAPNGHTATWAAAHVRVDRGSWTQFSFNEAEVLKNVEVEYKASAVTDNCIPMGLINCKNEYLGSLVVATFASKAREIIAKMREVAPGKPFYYVGIINEPYNCGEKGSNASDYALLCKAVYEECESHAIPLWPTAGGVMLGVSAHLTYQKKTSEKVAGAFSDWTLGAGWMRDFVAAWPGSVTKVNAFEIHPYGNPRVAATPEGNNHIASGKLQREQAIAAGFTLASCPGINNWWVGEVGYNTEGAEGEFGKVANNAEQASKLQEALEQMYEWWGEGWLKCINVFADGAANWGIFGKPAQATLENFAKPRAA